MQKQIAPELVAERNRGRLNRRTYRSDRCNFQWHLDGYDKLNPFGIAIHGCVDGFSRLVLWLEVGVTNKKTQQICKYFIEAVRTYGLPETVRTDAGTENVNVHWAQTFLCADNGLVGRLPPFLVGSSNHNERIERFWGLLRLQRLNYWINHFKDMVGRGEMVAWDDTDRSP